MERQEGVGVARQDVDRMVASARRATEQGLHAWLSRSIRQLSHRAGLGPTLQRLGHGQVAVLFYHKVQRRPFGLWGEPVLNVEAFEQHLSYLERHFDIISLPELAAGLRGERPLPERGLVLTFDDGYRHNLVLAAPILLRHRLPATFFLATSLVGSRGWMWAYELEEMLLRYPPEEVGRASGRPVLEELCSRGLTRPLVAHTFVRYLKALPHAELLRVMDALRARLPVEVDDENRFLTWDEARELHALGFDIGAHTATHPILVRVPLTTVERELRECRDVLQRELGLTPRAFAYPNGDTSPEVTACVGRLFELAVTCQPGVCSRLSHRLELPRICAPVALSDLAFEVSRPFVNDGLRDVLHEGPTPVALPVSPVALPPPTERREAEAGMSPRSAAAG